MVWKAVIEHTLICSTEISKITAIDSLQNADILAFISTWLLTSLVAMFLKRNSEALSSWHKNKTSQLDLTLINLVRKLSCHFLKDEFEKDYIQISCHSAVLAEIVKNTAI